MTDFVTVQCPWCFEPVEVGVELDTWGEMVQDCEVCCNPWTMRVSRDEYGDPVVTVDRLDG